MYGIAEGQESNCVLLPTDEVRERGGEKLRVL
jgi:hypothetical protein